MYIRVNPASSTPLYSQVVEQIKHAVASGRLRSGDQLPSVREMAIDLRINPNTVAKAYRELERDGVVQARQGSGVFVADQAPVLQKGERLKIAARHMDQAIVQAVNLALDPEDIKTLFADRLEKINGRKPKARE